MNKSRTFIFIFLSVIIILAESTQNISSAVKEEKFIFTYTINIKNNGARSYPLKEFDKLILMPEDKYQKMEKLEVKMNGKNIEVAVKGVNEDGNIEAILSGMPKQLASNQQLKIEIKIYLTISEREKPKLNVNWSGTLKDIPETIKDKYCKMDGPWIKSQNASIIAKSLAENESNVLKIVFKFIQWIENNIKIPNGTQPKLPTYPDETIKIKVGDCDDQANLLVAMCRSIGIPAYTQLSFLYMKGEKYEEVLFNGHFKYTSKNVGGHGWAMIFIPPWGWIPVDMTYFRGAKLKDGRIVSSNFMDHITGAAIYLFTTMITENIVHEDYIKELKEWILDLQTYNLTWKETYSLEERIEEENGTAIIVAIGGLSAIIIVITAIYVIAKRRKREEYYETKRDKYPLNSK